MSAVRDVSGMRFGRIEVIERVGSDKHGHSKWLCKCDCGKEIIVTSDSLVRKTQVSCGCHRRDILRIKTKTHGKSHTRMYKIWQGIKRRCLNVNNINYKNYGGRGISICEEWKEDFVSFYNWSIQNGYKEHLSIDRIDNNGNYEPSNCRWVTKSEQSNNTRKNRILTFNGESHTIAEWSKVTGISADRIERRINRDSWSIERALTEKVKKDDSR